MLHGDISNQAGTTIAFQCVGTLLDFQTDTLSDKVLNFFGGKERRLVLNEKVFTVMEYIYRSTDMAIDLVVFENDYTERLAKYLKETCPFNRILVVKRPSQIGSRLRTGSIDYYVDNDPETRGLVNSRYAIPFDDLHKVIKITGTSRRRKF